LFSSSIKIQSAEISVVEAGSDASLEVGQPLERKAIEWLKRRKNADFIFRPS
jgi:hypothetical protein